jgi:signal transduction histidine kinase
MTENRVRLRSLAGRALRNPHFWIVLALSTILLVLYQAWPWRESQFTHGFWGLVPWLSNLGYIVSHIELPRGVFGVLFLIPIIYGSIALSWPGGVLAWMLSLIWVLPELSSWSVRREPTNLLILFLPVLLAAIVSGERRWREGERRYYAEREEERQAYIAKLVDSQEAERRRIAQEIHDETLQTLLVISNKLDSLASSFPGHEQTKGILWANQKLAQSMDDLRRLSMNLRPNVLDNFGLVAGVRWLVDNTGQGTCQITTLVKGEVQNMSSLAEVTVFRVVQESVSNIQRHAHAQTASVTLEFDGDQLKLDVQDDGIGFEQAERSSKYAERNKLGIIGMEHRIQAIGGFMHLRSSPGLGTRLEATIPYSASGEIV